MTRTAIAMCISLACAGSGYAQAPSRADMEKGIIAGMYRQTCEQAKALGHTKEVVGCTQTLIKTRGPAFAKKLQRYSDDQVRKLYQQYRPKS